MPIITMAYVRQSVICPPALASTRQILEKAGYTQRELNQLERKGLIVRNHERKN